MDFELNGLSDLIVNERTNLLVTKERQISTKLLVYLGEFDKRSLYAKEAYPSLFQYLVGKWNFSEGAAARRVTGARMLRKFPRMIKMLESGDMHLTGMQMLAQHLTEENADELLGMCRRKSKREMEELLARKFAVAAPKREVVKFVAPVALALLEEKLTASPARHSQLPKAASGISPAQSPPPDVRIAVTLDQQTYSSLKRAQALTGAANMSDVLKEALELFLDKKDPERKYSKTVNEKKSVSKQDKPNARLPTAQMKREVYKRDGGQCTYVCKTTGRRCDARIHLQFDHILPYAAGGVTSVEDLRLYCRTHNLDGAREFFGRAFIDAKIASSTKQAPTRLKSAITLVPLHVDGGSGMR